MKPQIVEALKRAGIQLGVSAVAVAAALALDVVPPEYAAFAGPIVASIKRAVEGWLDAQRAANGEVMPSDVGAFAQPLPH